MTTETTPPAQPEIRLDRESLVRRTIEKIRSDTRRGVRSQVEDLDDEILIDLGLHKVEGHSHTDIHAILVGIVGLEDAPNLIALNRWLSRFGHLYDIERAAERSRLAREIDHAAVTEDLQEASLLANRMLVGKVLDTLADTPDLTDLNKTQSQTLVQALKLATAAGFDEKKLAADLQTAELKAQRLQQQIDDHERLVKAQYEAAEKARAEIERRATQSGSGVIDRQTVLEMLDKVIRGDAA